MHFDYSPQSAPVLSERIDLAEREALKDVVGKFGMPGSLGMPGTCDLSPETGPGTPDLSFQAPPAPLPDGGHVEVIDASVAKVEAAAECITLRPGRREQLLAWSIDF